MAAEDLQLGQRVIYRPYSVLHEASSPRDQRPEMYRSLLALKKLYSKEKKNYLCSVFLPAAGSDKSLNSSLCLEIKLRCTRSRSVQAVCGDAKWVQQNGEHREELGANKAKDLSEQMFSSPPHACSSFRTTR